MTLKEVVLSPEAMTAIQGMIIERLKNVKMIELANSSTTPVDCLIAEICVVEAKLDAFMKMSEVGEKDFSKFNEYMTEAAIAGKSSALKTRELITAGLKRKG